MQWNSDDDAGASEEGSEEGSDEDEDGDDSEEEVAPTTKGKRKAAPVDPKGKGKGKPVAKKPKRREFLSFFLYSSSNMLISIFFSFLQNLEELRLKLNMRLRLLLYRLNKCRIGRKIFCVHGL